MLLPMLSHIPAILLNLFFAITAAPTTVKPDSNAVKLTTTQIALKKDARQWYAVPNPAYLGDPCAKDSDCKVDHSVCISNTNIWWNGQPFCTCAKNYEPRTGDCILKNNSGIHPTEILSNEITHTSTSENLFTPEPTLKTFPLRTFDSAIPPLDEIDTTKLRIRQVIEQIAQIRHSGNISVRDSTDSSADLELTEQPPEYNFESTVVPVLEPPQPLPDWVTWVQLEPQKSVQTTTTITTNPTTTTETVVRQTSSVKPRKAAELASLLMANRLVISRDQAKSSDTPENLKQTRSDGTSSLDDLKTKANCVMDPNSNSFLEMTPEMLSHFNDTITRVIGSLDSLNTHEIRDLFKEAVEKVLNMYITRVVITDSNTNANDNGVNRKPTSQAPSSTQIHLI